MAFDKYQKYGAYHWRDIEWSYKHLLKGFSLPLYTRYHEILKRIEGNGKHVLEIGCGDGALAHLIARRGHIVCGIDIDTLAIKLAIRESARFPYQYVPMFHCADVRTYEFRGMKFDYVVMADVIEHLHNPEEILHVCKDVLKKEGKVLLTTPYNNRRFKWDVSHVIEYDDHDLYVLLSNYFSKVLIAKFMPFALYKFYQKTVTRKCVFNFMSFCFNPLSLNLPRCEHVMIVAVAES